MKRRLLNVTLAMALCVLFASFSANASEKLIKAIDLNAKNVMIGNNHKWKSTSLLKKSIQEKSESNKVTLEPAQDYGFVTATDGSQWYVTQKYTVKNYYYSASEITLYDSKGEQQSSFKVTIPEGKSCNQIMVGEVMTSNLFDRDNSSNELIVIAHIIHSPGVASFISYIYDIATGELKHTYDGLFSVVKYFTGYNYDVVGVLSYTAEEGGQKVSKYDIYAKPGYGKNSAELKHTFSVPNKLAEYQLGSVLNLYEVDNSMYYVLSQYEKEYLDPASYQEPWDMIPTAGNNFVATIYNKNFKEVGKVTIPVTSTINVLVQYGVGLFGYKDLTNDFWDESGEMRLVITTSEFEVNTEKETIAFDVYNTNSEKVKTIAKNVSNWMNMYDIPGEPSQMVFLANDGASMSMVDLPACETVVTFGAEIEGNAVSTNIDRCLVGDSYQYVIGLPSPETAANGDIYQRYAWVKKDGTIDRIVKFNLGSNNVNWTPLVIGEVLNPYLFDTDSEREYIFIANQRVGNTSNMIDEVRIMKEDGTLVRSFVEDASTKGDLGSCSLLGLDGDMPTIFVPFYNSNTDEINIEMEFLPFAMMSAGGEGTIDNPYLISSAGDMAMIARNPAAHYKVVKNFDASDFGLWKGITAFTGSFDGDDHIISNIILNGDAECAGIFATSELATIKNVILKSPKIELTEMNSAAGLLVGEAVSDTIFNVHVINAEITGDGSSSSVGGIVGKGMFNTFISGSSVTELSAEADGAVIGGIAGSTLTTSNISACNVNGSIVGGSAVGGVVGSASLGCAVKDCHVDATIEGENTIGGVVGEADRGGIFNCYVNVSLTATNANVLGYGKVGGVAGSLSADWETTAESVVDSVVAGNVVKLEAISAPNMKGVHRIIGYSRFEDDTEAAKWDPTLVPVKEVALANNYVVSTISAIDSTVGADARSTEGADIEAEALNKAFFEGLGYKYGNDVENPWDAESDAEPCLYFEKVDRSAIETVVAQKSKVQFNGKSVFAADAVAVELYSIAGAKVVAVKGASLSVAELPAGVYVVVATDATGAKATAKIMVK